MPDPVLSVLIASDRVAELLPECLASLAAQVGAPEFEVVVASAVPPSALPNASLSLRWVEAEDRNPSRRRNRAAAGALGTLFAFLDDDATAEPGWLAAGAAALTRCSIAGGPDLCPTNSPYRERVSDLLLATPWIGSGIPAHQRAPRPGPVRSPHDVALCNLFVSRSAFESVGGFDESFGYIGEDTDFVGRALSKRLRVELDPAIVVRHRRRGFPAAFLAQRWRYRVKTGRLLIERPGLHARGQIAAFLAIGCLGIAGALLLGLRFAIPALAAYAALTWSCSFSIWCEDPILFPAVPLAFAAHHATAFLGLLVGLTRGVLGRKPAATAATARGALP